MLRSCNSDQRLPLQKVFSAPLRLGMIPWVALLPAAVVPATAAGYRSFRWAC